MSEQEQQDQSHRPRKSSKSRLPVYLFITVLLLALAGAGLYLFTRPEKSLSPPADGQRQGTPAPSVVGPVQPAPGTEQARQSVAAEGAAPGSTLPGASGQAGQCAVLAKQLHGFFRHVDQQDYLGQ